MMTNDDKCRQLLENLGFHDALPPEPSAEPSGLSSVDQAASSLEDAHLTNAGLAGDGFGGDGTSPHAGDNGELFEQPGNSMRLLVMGTVTPAGRWLLVCRIDLIKSRV